MKVPNKLLVREWRTSLTAVLQVAMALPFMMLIPYALSSVPDNERPIGPVLGLWTSQAAEQIVGESAGLNLRLERTGEFELRAVIGGVRTKRLYMRGGYVLREHRLVLSAKRRKMVWDLQRSGDDLLLTNAEGQSIRMRRVLGDEAGERMLRAPVVAALN